jgi:hypothetical protein
MKVTGLALEILGGLMILLNLLGWFGASKDHLPGPDANTVNVVAYYIGFNIFFIIGGILLATGFWLRRKAKRKKVKKELLDNFLSDSPKN